MLTIYTKRKATLTTTTSHFPTTQTTILPHLDFQRGLRDIQQHSVSLVFSFLSAVVLLECIYQIALSKLGSALGVSDEPLNYDPSRTSHGRRLARLDRRIDESLRHLQATGNEDDCCAICLEGFSAGDPIVTAKKPCCASSVFRRECLAEWLRIHNSCPCCRQSILIRHVPEQEPAIKREGAIDSEEPDCGAHGSFRLRCLARWEAILRMRSEILSYFDNQIPSR